MSDYERIQVETPENRSVIPTQFDDNFEHYNPGAALGAVPVLGHANNATSVIWGMAEGEVDVVGGTMQIMATVADVMNQGATRAINPAAFLAGALVDVLVALIQPLENLIHEVSGDPGGMRSAAEAWQGIAEADVQLSDAVAATLTPLADWTTDDGATARARIDDLAASLFTLAKQCSKAQQILAGAQVLAEAIKEAIKWMLSKLVEWLLVYVAPQLAAAPFTFGATAATATATASVQAAQTTTQAVSMTQRIINAMTQLGQLVKQVMSSDLGGIVIASLQYTPGTVGNAISNRTTGSAATAGSGGSRTADPEVLSEVAPTFNMIAEDASGVADKVAETAQDGLTWGICGAISWVFDYDDLVSEINALHQDASNSLDTLAANISAAAEEWTAADTDTAALFENIQTDLQGSGSGDAS
jgi:hypothetical protein